MPASIALRFQSSLGTRSVDTRVATWREDDLSIEAVAATETPTRMRIYDYDRECGSYRSREYDEILDVSGLTDADISGFVGCPILDSHSYWSSMTIVGVVDEARREGTELIVRFRMAKTEEEIVSKVRDGIIRKVSIGYDRRAGATVTEREGDVPLRRQPFVPRELSLVAIGADPNAGTRSASSLASLSPPAVPSNPTQEPAMNVDAIRSAATGLAAAVAALQTALVTETPAAPSAPGTRAADPVDQAGQDAIEGRRAPQTPPVTQPAAPAAPTATVVGQRSAADQAAIMGLRSIAKGAGKEAEFDAFASAGETLDGLRSLARGYVATTSPETNGTTSGADGERSTETFVTHEEAIAGRRSGGGDIAALAQALAGFVAR